MAERGIIIAQIYDLHKNSNTKNKENGFDWAKIFDEKYANHKVNHQPNINMRGIFWQWHIVKKIYFE